MTPARELTRALDEIVWAVNPEHDTLDSLGNYLGKFAQDYLGPLSASAVVWIYPPNSRRGPSRRKSATTCSSPSKRLYTTLSNMPPLPKSASP